MNTAIITGILVCLIFLLLILAFLMGFSFGKTVAKEPQKSIIPEIDDENKRKIENKLKAEQRFFDFTG